MCVVVVCVVVLFVFLCVSSDLPVILYSVVVALFAVLSILCVDVNSCVCVFVCVI